MAILENYVFQLYVSHMVVPANDKKYAVKS